MGSSSSTVATVLLAPGGVRLRHHQLCGATLRYNSYLQRMPFKFINVELFINLKHPKI
jgi:hypothetical protein